MFVKNATVLIQMAAILIYANSMWKAAEQVETFNDLDLDNMVEINIIYDMIQYFSDTDVLLASPCL